MRRCRLVTAAFVFVVFLPNSPVSLAAGGCKKRRAKKALSKAYQGRSSPASPEEGHTTEGDFPGSEGGKTPSRAFGGRSSSGAPEEGHTKEGSPSGSEGCTGSTEAGPPKGSTKGRGPKIRKEVEEQLHEVQREIPLLVVEDKDDTHDEEAATSTFPGTPKPPECETAKVEKKQPGAGPPAHAEPVSAISHMLSTVSTDPETTREGARNCTPGVPAGDDNAASPISEELVTAPTVSATGDEDALGRTRPWTAAALSLLGETQIPLCNMPAAADAVSSSCKARALRRSVALAHDVADALRHLCGVYRIRGGSDLIEIRRFLQRALNRLSAAMITDRSLWTDSAAEALRHGQDTLFALNARDPSMMKGVQPPMPCFTQVAKTKPLYRVEVVEQKIATFFTDGVVPVYDADLQGVGGPPEAKRVIFDNLNAAAAEMQELKNRYRDVWYLYAEFLLVWLLVKQQKVKAEMEGAAAACS